VSSVTIEFCSYNSALHYRKGEHHNRLHQQFRTTYSWMLRVTRKQSHVKTSRMCIFMCYFYS